MRTDGMYLGAAEDGDVRVVDGEILFEKRSPHQDICLFRERSGAVSLTLDRYWQFHSPEERLYHETLVGGALASSAGARRVLILGGGDGLAVRDALAFPSVRQVVLVELDPEMVRMSSSQPDMVRLNRGALLDPRTAVVVGDAGAFLSDGSDAFDAVVCDFPDPTSPGLARLFTAGFYRLVRSRLAPGGVVSVQASSPSSELDFALVLVNLSRAFAHVKALVPKLPAMGDIGIALASDRPIVRRRTFPAPYRFLSDRTMAEMEAAGDRASRAALSKYGVLVA